MRLDEIAPATLKELQAIGRAHVQSGKGKEDCTALATLLTTGRGRSGVGAPTTTARRLRAWPAALLMRIGNGIAARRARSRL